MIARKTTKRDWKDYVFDPSLSVPLPKTINDCKAELLGCFAGQGKAITPTPEQRWVVAFLIRLGGYDGRLITNLRGQFYQDVRDYYVTGLFRHYGEA